jgi:hypothetical protein
VRIYFILFLAFIFVSQGLRASDSTVNKNRLILITAGGSALYAGSMIALYQTWYKDYPRSSFHFINDNSDWLQMDKVGHTFTAYQESAYGYRMMRWAGLPESQATWLGGGLGFILQTPFEILDGFSAQWGASAGDLAANTAGSLLFISQQLAWQEQMVQLKFSYTPSPYAKLNPFLLGSNFPERLVKDYNGQTYWLSIGIQDITSISAIPPWLNIAVGYGGNGMLRGSVQDQSIDPRFNDYARARQFYLSPDINFEKIPTKKPWLRKVCTVIACLKVPAPALEYQQGEGFKAHFLYF